MEQKKLSRNYPIYLSYFEKGATVYNAQKKTSLSITGSWSFGYYCGKKS